MPWAAPSYLHMQTLAAAVQSAYGLISSIPMLLVVDADTLELLTSGGRPWVQADTSAAAFPWRGQPTPPSDFRRSSLLPMLIVSARVVCVCTASFGFLFYRACRWLLLALLPSVWPHGIANAAPSGTQCCGGAHVFAKAHASLAHCI